VKKNPFSALSRRKFLASLSALGIGYFILPRNSRAAATSPATDVVDIAPVWAAQTVGFCLLTHGDQQFVAFYDAQRQMTLAQRTLGSPDWKFKKLPSSVGWDSHNYVTMALDRNNSLHVSGNMHAVPLVYFRGGEPLDIDSVEPVNRMVGNREQRVTYPRFYSGPDGELLFCYRDGSSGNGDNLINVFDEASGTWRRYLDTPLMQGNGIMNAYMGGPKKGPDGYYNLTWVWRNSPDASTNHDLSYMRSLDLIHWETIDGKPVKLPVTIKTPGVIVDPVPVKGGILNGAGAVGFDLSGQPLISYFKYDVRGNTQLYLARFENGAWKHYQASNWDYRCDFSGGGSFVAPIRVGAVECQDGKMVISFWHIKYGYGNRAIDPETMRLAAEVPKPRVAAESSKLDKVESSFPGMIVHWSPDLGTASDGRKYRLRWEALSQNRDRPRNPPWPPPSMLRVVGTE